MGGDPKYLLTGVILQVFLFEGLLFWRWNTSNIQISSNSSCWFRNTAITTCDVQNLVNNGINCLSTGAGFLPSTVPHIAGATIYYTSLGFKKYFGNKSFRGGGTPPKLINHHLRDDNQAIWLGWNFPSKIKWDLTNGPRSVEPLDTQVVLGPSCPSSGSCWWFLGFYINWAVSNSSIF